MKSIVVQVTEDDIHQGVIAECTACPVARALNRATKLHWTVGHSFAQCGEILLTFPTKVEDFIHRFDDGLPVAPISFRISLDV